MDIPKLGHMVRNIDDCTRQAGHGSPKYQN